MQPTGNPPISATARKNAGWVVGLILFLLLTICFLWKKDSLTPESHSVSTETRRSSKDTSPAEFAVPGEWKSKERPEPKRPAMMPLTPEQHGRAIAEDIAFRKRAYEAYEAALERDAASNPELRKTLDLRKHYGKDLDKLDAATAKIWAWQRASGSGRGWWNEATQLTGLLSEIRPRHDADLRAILGPPDPMRSKGLAGSLIDLGIPPTAVMEGVAQDDAALTAIEQQLYQRLDRIAGQSNAPPDYFTRTIYDLMLGRNLHSSLGARAKSQATPTTQALAGKAAKEVAAHAQEMRKRADEQMRANAAAP